MIAIVMDALITPFMIRRILWTRNGRSEIPISTVATMFVTTSAGEVGALVSTVPFPQGCPLHQDRHPVEPAVKNVSVYSTPRLTNR